MQRTLMWTLACALACSATAAWAQDTTGLASLTGENSSPLQITGFGVVDAHGNGRTGDNGFDAGKLAVSMFRELTDRVWIFGQLTTSVARDQAPGADEASTDVEIDNLIVNLTPPAWSSVSFAVGKFDTPLGFERDDEPLNLQATTSFNFDRARPTKMVGAIGRWAASPKVDVAAWVANGWQSDLEPNHGKTVGARLGVRPSERVSAGIGGLWGPEGDHGDTRIRYLLSADYELQPDEQWIVGGELNAGGDRATGGVEPDTWYGATATVFRRFSEHVGTTTRVEAFKDSDGARTGTPQTLTSLTIAPVYFAGVGREGIFATIEGTTFRIPRFQIRGEVRFDHSSAEDAFRTRAGAGPWTVNYVAQIVATF